MIYLDTHVVVWLYSGDLFRFPEAACKLIEDNDLLISPMVLLELQYLYESNRVIVEPMVIFDSLAENIGLRKCPSPFGRIIAESMSIGWTRDPFDRIITATAALHDAILLTKDEQIRQEYPKVRWE